MRPAGTKPICTFFGRTVKGGFLTGVEMPFDAWSAKGRQVLLAYSPSLKVRVGEAVSCEAAYLGVYRRLPGEQETEGLPLESESDAMVAMNAASQVYSLGGLALRATASIASSFATTSASILSRRTRLAST
jgi:hypothetical protein